MDSVSLRGFLAWFWRERRERVGLFILLPLALVVLGSFFEHRIVESISGLALLVAIAGGGALMWAMQTFARAVSRRLLLGVCFLQVAIPFSLFVLSGWLTTGRGESSGIVKAILLVVLVMLCWSLLGLIGCLRVVGKPESSVRLAAKHAVSGQLGEAFDYVDLAALSGEQGRQDLLQLALELRRVNQPDLGRVLLERACQIVSTDANLWRGLADLSWLAGEREQSLAATERALALQPKNADIYYDRGCKLSRESATYQKALEDYTKAIGLDSAKPHYWANRAALNGRMERYDHALADAKKAHSLNPDDQVAIAQGLNAAQKLGKAADVEFWMSRLEGPARTGLPREVFESLAAQGQQADRLVGQKQFEQAASIYEDILKAMLANGVIDSFLLAKLTLGSMTCALAQQRSDLAHAIWTGTVPGNSGTYFKMGVELIEGGSLSLHDTLIYQTAGCFLHACDTDLSAARSAVDKIMAGVVLASRETMPQYSNNLVGHWRYCLQRIYDDVPTPADLMEQVESVAVKLGLETEAAPSFALIAPAQWKIDWE